MVSFPQLRVRCDTSFQGSPQNGARNFLLSLHYIWLLFNSRLFLVISPSQLANSHFYLVESSSQLTFKTWVVPLLPHDVRGRNISVSCGSTPALKVWELRFLVVILFIVFIQLWLVDLHRVILSDSLKGFWSFRRLSICYFFLFPFLSLTFQKVASCSCYNMDSPQATHWLYRSCMCANAERMSVQWVYESIKYTSSVTR